MGLSKVFNTNLKFRILWCVLWLATARGLCSDITSYRSTESICFKKALEESLKYVKDHIHDTYAHMHTNIYTHRHMHICI